MFRHSTLTTQILTREAVSHPGVAFSLLSATKRETALLGRRQGSGPSSSRKGVNDKPLLIWLHFTKDFHLCYLIGASHEPCEGGGSSPIQHSTPTSSPTPTYARPGAEPNTWDSCKNPLTANACKTYLTRDRYPGYRKNLCDSVRKRQITPFKNRQKICTDTSQKKVYEWPISISKKITSLAIIIRKCKTKPQQDMLIEPQWLKLKSLTKPNANEGVNWNMRNRW